MQLNQGFDQLTSYQVKGHTENVDDAWIVVQSKFQQRKCSLFNDWIN